MTNQNIRIRDIRTLPFFWIQRALLDVVKPNGWRAILAYNALAYYAAGESSACKDVGIRTLAKRVCVSEDTMKRGLAELAKVKAIRIKPRYQLKNGKRVQLPNDYVLIDLVAPAPI